MSEYFSCSTFHFHLPRGFPSPLFIFNFVLFIYFFCFCLFPLFQAFASSPFSSAPYSITFSPQQICTQLYFTHCQFFPLVPFILQFSLYCQYRFIFLLRKPFSRPFLFSRFRLPRRLVWLTVSFPRTAAAILLFLEADNHLICSSFKLIQTSYKLPAS